MSDRQSFPLLSFLADGLLPRYLVGPFFVDATQREGLLAGCGGPWDSLVELFMA